MPYENTGGPVHREPGPAPKPIRGLFDVAEVVESSDPHTILGVEYLTNLCTAGKEWPEFCEQATAKQASDLSLVESLNFAVYDAIACPMGVTQDEQEAKVRASFDAKAEAVTESVLKDHLSSATPITGGSVEELIAKLEAALAEGYAGQGIIHLDRFAASVAGSQGAFQNVLTEAGVVRTWVGTPVVMGRGYGGGAPWAAATGRVTVLRGPLRVYRTPSNKDAGALVLAEQPITVLAECVVGQGEVGP